MSLTETQQGLEVDIKGIENRYGAEKQIARGGMKSISVVSDFLTGRKVAKAGLISLEDPDDTSRFFYEGRICARLEHPNIVPVYDLGYDQDKLPFFTMRLLGGETLQSLVMNEKLELGECLDIFVKVCDAVSYAHSQGVIHRDLKPDNIQIGQFGEVQVCDWGIAHVDGNSMTRSHKDYDLSYNIPVTLDGVIQGTPGFIAPEQIEEDHTTTESSDIYSLGAILYVLLTGIQPAKSDSVDLILEKTVSGKIEPIDQISSGVPYSLQAICYKAMALKPEDRYSSVELLKTDISNYQHGFATEAEDAGLWQNIVLLIKRNRRLSLLTAFFVVVLNISLVIFFYNLNKEKNRAIGAENEAKRSLEELIRVTDERNRVAKEAAPTFLDKARQNLVALEYDKAIENSRHSIALDPEFYLAHFFHGILLTGDFKFDEAYRAFSLGKPETADTTLEALAGFARKFKGRTKMSVSDIIDIVKVLKESGQPYDLLHSVVYSPKLDHWTTEERRQLAIAGFKIYLNDYPPPIFNGDAVSDIWRIPNRYVLHFLYKTGISEFNFSHSTWTELPMIKGDVTRKVYIGDFPPNYFLKAFAQCPNLEEIVIAEKYHYPRFLEDLPEHLKISTYKPEVEP